MALFNSGPRTVDQAIVGLLQAKEDLEKVISYRQENKAWKETRIREI